MTTAEGPLSSKIREKIRRILSDGHKVAAIRFYYDVTMSTLVESKQFIDSFPMDGKTPIGNERFRKFLTHLENRDIGGAAASLLEDVSPPPTDEAIDRAIHVARLLDIDVSPLELPKSLGTLSECPQAQAVVAERCYKIVRERMIQRHSSRVASREEAEREIDEVLASLAQGNHAPPNPHNVSLDGLDPQLARAVRMLMEPIPMASGTVPALAATTEGLNKLPTQLRRGGRAATTDVRRIWLSWIGRSSSLVYAAIALVGLWLVGYSYCSTRSLKAFELSDELSATEQYAEIEAWKRENLPPTISWFIFSVSEEFFPLSLEPDLPLAYHDETWTWEKKIDAVNRQASALLDKHYRCHKLLLSCYALAIVFAIIHWFNQGIASGILMTIIGILGVRYLVVQSFRMEVDNPLWLTPLLIPGVIALVAAILEVAWVAPTTERQKELQGFWLGVMVFSVTFIVLVWAIENKTHLRTGAGLGLFGGAWLMFHHGRRYLYATSKVASS